MKCVILVGGSGERLWPVSRDLYPKSMMKINGSKSFLENTFELASLLVSPRNIVCIANVKHAVDVKVKLKKLYSKPVVISEPIAKNTAAAIASSLIYLESSKDDVCAFIPCDFTVKDKDEFVLTIEKAKKLANKGHIVAVGVKPQYPETGYGYIKTSEKTDIGYKISSFTEKPSFEKAQDYTKDGSYFWNTGIYVARKSAFLNAIKKYAPEIVSGMDKDMFQDDLQIKYSAYEKIPSISIDYAVIEKADNLVMVEMNTKWLDFGSWKSVYDNSKKDKKNNVIQGNVLVDNVESSFIYSTKELVAVSDVKDTIVIETEDAILVCDKKESQNINQIVKKLRETNHNEAMLHKTVYRPWGYYTCLNSGSGWLSKIITVSPGQKLSLQSHNHRSEHWVVLEGKATVILDDETYNLNKRQSINIPVQARHSLQNLEKEPLKILEVQKGDYISEDDIVRYQDIYGRVK